MSNTKVYKVIGAPGTGKTTRVVGNADLDVTSLVQENLDKHPMDQQMIVTYTKSGVEEAQERLDALLDVPQYIIQERVLTIHAYCYRAIGVNQDQVVRWWHERNFCEANGLEYGKEDDNGDIMSSESDEGHTLFQIYGWLKSNRKDLKDYDDCPVKYPGNDDPYKLMMAWEDYKDKKDLIQFSDMIEMTVERAKEELKDAGYPSLFGGGPEDAMDVFKETGELDRFDKEEWRGRSVFPDTRVLYVDEVQDLTPLQWAWYLMAKLVADKVYIGGDDDQTIYGWAGANPNFMLDEEGDFEVLDKTYRIPENIWEVCDGVIKQVDKRQEKDVEPHGEGGEVYTYHSPPARQLVKEHLMDGECMVLFRANYMIDEFVKSLQKHGVPYRNMSTFDNWSDDIVTLRDALAKIKNGEDVLTSDEVEVMKEYAVRECANCGGGGCAQCNYNGEENMVNDDTSFTNKESALGKIGGGVKMDRVRKIFDLSHPYERDKLTWKNFLLQSSEVNHYEEQCIRGNLRNGNEDMYPDRLRIGTIHSSKGKEAETVMVATDSTETIISNMIEETAGEDKIISDAERRVYYVGMTRASEELVLVEGAVNREFSLSLNHLLDGFEDKRGEWGTENAELSSGWGQ